MRSHEWIDQRSLALDLAVAEKIRHRPALLEQARATLVRWINQRQPVPPVLLEWQSVIDGANFDQILGLLTSDGEYARRR